MILFVQLGPAGIFQGQKTVGQTCQMNVLQHDISGASENPRCGTQVPVMFLRTHMDFHQENFDLFKTLFKV